MTQIRKFFLTPKQARVIVLSQFPLTPDPFNSFRLTWEQWKKHAENLETVYYQGNLQAVVAAVPPLEEQYGQFPRPLRLNPIFRQIRLKYLGFQALSHRALHHTEAYEKVSNLIAAEFDPQDISTHWFPDDFVSTLRKKQNTLPLQKHNDLLFLSQPIALKWTSWNLPLDTQIITQTLSTHTELHAPLTTTLSLLTEYYPDTDVWFLHHTEDSELLFCHRYPHSPSWECLSHPLQPQVFSSLFPTLLTHHSKHRPAPKLLSDFQTFQDPPLSNVSSPPSSPSPSSSSWLSSLPWWAWAGGVVLVGGATIYFINSSGSEASSPQSTGTVAWP